MGGFALSHLLGFTQGHDVHLGIIPRASILILIWVDGSRLCENYGACHQDPSIQFSLFFAWLFCWFIEFSNQTITKRNTWEKKKSQEYVSGFQNSSSENSVYTEVQKSYI